ncbi:nitronate monooxygenase [Gordonia sp. NPDC003585]|uniref:nitronate monooxygenase n=1 Tax=Gordonia sp. NPDC003585 TaxID=3154275 RepID=UPI0033A2B2C4
MTGEPMRIGALDIEVPIVCAPMAGGPTTPALVRAIAEAGGLGMLAAGYLTAAALAPLVEEVDEATEGRYGVNLFLPGRDVLEDASDPLAADVTNYRRRLARYADRYGVEVGEPRWFDEDIAAKVSVLADHRPALVTVTFGDPGPDLVERIHREVGAAVGVTVTSVIEAHAAVASGADLLIAQGIEAGGHRGIWTDDPRDPLGGPGLGSHDLVAELAAAQYLPVIAAGGLMSGADIVAVRGAGAIGAQLGTAFLRADEAGTSVVHRTALADHNRAGEPETVITRAFSGRPARSLATSFAEDNADAPAAYPQVHYMTKPIRAAAASAGVADDVNLWAGTGWRRARTGSAAAIVDRVRAEMADPDRRT